LSISWFKRKSKFNKFFELIFFPSFCHLCSCLLERSYERVVCRNCLLKLKARRTAFCLCCGRFFELSGENHICASCLNQRPPFTCHRSCGLYRGEIKDVLLLFKYRKYKILGKPLAEFIYRSLGQDESLWWGVGFIIPVPLHPKRESERGFNQAEVMARELAEMKGVELASDWLVKKIHTPPQTTLSGTDRCNNITGVFELADKTAVKDKIVLILDDVYTTGATIKECSTILMKGGAKEVRALTVAQA